MNRRSLMTGAAAVALTTPFVTPAFAVERAQRTFRIFRSGKDIGTHKLSATLDNNGFQIEIRIDIAVKFLGITAYNYNLINREQWKDGELVDLNSRVNDDGTDDFSRVMQKDGKLSISGSRFTGEVDLEAVSTSYYQKAFIERRPWISTQSGRPLDVTVTKVSDGRYAVAGDLETTLLYDGRGEFVGTEFDAGGELGTYEVESETGAIAELWAAA